MKGLIFALLGGMFITLQGVANASISLSIGTWQAATITQLTGFLVALVVLLLMRDKGFKEFKQVKPLYLISGALASIIIFTNVTAIHLLGVTLTIAALLIAQLVVTFFVDSRGYFDIPKQKMRLPQFIGIGLMIVGVIVLQS
ncbi:DMT family transporter [Paenalkalicoccus suaedae]|uniref:DMT family transporter n=1 Tax=Paenalkalicoccus suaedae TaxID=2592382 RepID=A0A859FB74_9BACI|nr:DMT family transporter [Paenalkalicoccus suaedae]QKS70519.1 DMT family transporter [Paenalkalicoccus suaedae]